MSSEDLCCLFCKESFGNKDELQVHFRKHGDPKFNQNLKNTRKTDDPNSSTSNDKMGDGGETVKCDVCTEVFPTISKAITHKHKVHPDHDAKYFCPWCGKLFTMKHLYNKHVESNHSDKGGCEGKGFHCDYCDVNFFIPSAMLYHNKFFHRQDTELASIGQSRKLKMFSQEPLPIYYCPFCGEEYCNKVNLHKHMADDHSDENQSPDDVLRCPLCDAIFYHLDAYEVHLTFHSNEDIYSEENELLKQVTEFSLETTPPIMEKVENVEDEEQSINSIGIESLLQQAMNESADNDSSHMPERRKKHKKHKKSKKPAITLDEFLNMNKDVFGEGIDFQGIEEVPTQVVAKQLKKPPKLQMRAQTMQPSSSDIEKLKRQGIVIKKKSGKIPLQFPKKPAQNYNTIQIKDLKSVHNVQIKSEAQNKSTDDVLSKFLSNNQLKIVKKSVTEDNNMEKDDLQKPLDSKSDKCQEDKLSETEENENTQSIESEQRNKAIPLPDRVSEVNEKQTENNEINKISPKNDLELSNENNEILSSSKTLPDEENDKNFLKTDSSNIEDHKETVVTNSPKNVSENTSLGLPEANGTLISNSNVEEETDQNKNSNEKSTNSGKVNESNSLNVLKHLSNLVVKSVKKTNIPIPQENVGTDDDYDCNNSPKISDESQPIKKDIISKAIQEDKETKCIDTLKNLSKHLTIKSVSQSARSVTQNLSPKIDSNSERNKFKEDDMDSENDIDENVAKKSTLGNFKINSSIEQVKSPELKPSPNSPNRITSPHIKESKPNEQNVKQNTSNIQNTCRVQTTNLLNNLPNITAKSINVSKKVQNDLSSEKKCNQSTQINKDVKPKSVESEQTKKEIEIFNIDDSDEELNEQDISKVSPKFEHNAEIDPESKSVSFLKKISNQVTIKPKNIPQFAKNVVSLQNKTLTKSDSLPTVSNKTKITEKQNSVLHNTLKNLGKNITIKSNNNQIPERPSSRNSLEDEDYNLDTNPCPKKVQITECDDDDNISDNDFDKNEGMDNVTVEYPDEDNSENEHDNNGFDIEDEIKTTKLKKPISTANKTNTVKGYKNIKDAFHDFETDEEDQPDAEKDSDGTPNINNELSIKPFNHTKTLNSDNTMQNKNFKEVAHKMVNQQTNERTSKSTNQVTQEVTVKTIQSKTVVQEITTTVTKTIRTVNQTVKQDVRNTSQASSSIQPQKIQVIRPQQMKTNTGTIIKHAAPVQGPRIRNPTPQIRTPIRAQVRPSNQLVPFRGSTNTARPNAPRMPGMAKPGPKCSKQQLAMGKPLKISPNALVCTTKRPCEEPSGPFSCFKKQKESLIPVPELTDFDSDQEGESSMNYSSSHVSKTSFASSTNTIKGNKAVTTNQMKSEVSASSHLRKLSNVTGLKIMKTCQSKQSTQVEKTSESSAKRSTLEAIEKLQKQGLLLKKPRVEEEHNSEHTDPEDEDMDT